MAQVISGIPTQEDIDKENALICQLNEELEQTEYEESVKDLGVVYDVCTSLEGLLHYPEVLEHLSVFMWKERCDENLHFWNDVERYKKIHIQNETTKPEQVWNIADRIIDMYLNPGTSRFELYIPNKMIKEFHDMYSSIHNKEDYINTSPSIDIFDKLQNYIFNLIQRTSYQKFIRQDGCSRRLGLTAQHISRISEQH
ncbi:hypothetical protein WA158_006034 [Blastocystis sp. Blastoise]